MVAKFGDRIHCWGIPKLAAGQPAFTTIQGRIPFVEHLLTLGLGGKIHLLGLAWSPLEVRIIADRFGHEEVRGVDSSLPWLAARHGVTFGNRGLLYRPSTWKFDPYDTTDSETEWMVGHNIHMLYGYAMGRPQK